MNTRFLSALIFICAVAGAFSEPSDQEIIALMNKVQRGVAAGNVSSLNDLMTLPSRFAVPAFLTIFELNYYIQGATPTNRAIGEKCAELATSVTGGEQTFVTLLNAKTDDNLPLLQQKCAVKCLAIAHNKTAVRLLCGALDAPVKEVAGRSANALATMSLPGAPYASKQKFATSSPDEVLKWKEWWKANAGNYSD